MELTYPRRIRLTGSELRCCASITEVSNHRTGPKRQGRCCRCREARRHPRACEYAWVSGQDDRVRRRLVETRDNHTEIPYQSIEKSHLHEPMGLPKPTLVGYICTFQMSQYIQEANDCHLHHQSSHVQVTRPKYFTSTGNSTRSQPCMTQTSSKSLRTSLGRRIDHREQRTTKAISQLSFTRRIKNFENQTYASSWSRSRGRSRSRRRACSTTTTRRPLRHGNRRAPTAEIALSRDDLVIECAEV